MGEKGLNNRRVGHAGAFNHRAVEKQYRRGRGCRAGLIAHLPARWSGYSRCSR